ncbi:MAG: hypothetical protein CL582_11895 [Alteromonadaceae bacterium]|nr:hypothetical protein [Alteromonadaceae bacterium]|tara:strand:+ start:839 stop:1723 length:885 start_codon:yes stop_codon:yes gene_type:complete
MTAITTNTANLRDQILAFGAKIKEIAKDAKNAETADLAQNSLALEGQSLNDVVLLIAGTTGLTTLEVKNQLDAFIARTDNPHNVTAAQVGLGSVQNYGVADLTQAEELDAATATNEAYMTPRRVMQAINAFWESQAGIAPETLDTINEVAAAIQNNQDSLGVLNDAVATKAAKTTVDQLETDLTAAIDLKADQTAVNTQIQNLNDTIAALTKADIGLSNVDNFATATVAQTQSRTATDLFVTPAGLDGALTDTENTLNGRIDTKSDTTEVASSMNTLAQAFADATADLNAPYSG